MADHGEMARTGHGSTAPGGKVPKYGHRLRNVRVDDRLWGAAQLRAAKEGEALSEVIRRALVAYVEGGRTPRNVEGTDNGVEA